MLLEEQEGEAAPVATAAPHSLGLAPRPQYLNADGRPCAMEHEHVHSRAVQVFTIFSFAFSLLFGEALTEESLNGCCVGRGLRGFPWPFFTSNCIYYSVVSTVDA